MRVNPPPMAVPTSAPTAIMTTRVGQSSFDADNKPADVPIAMNPIKISFLIFTSLLHDRLHANKTLATRSMLLHKQTGMSATNEP